MTRAVSYCHRLRALLAIKWICGTLKVTRVEFKQPKRTLPQNDRTNALTDIAAQSTHCGLLYRWMSGRSSLCTASAGDALRALSR